MEITSPTPKFDPPPFPGNDTVWESPGTVRLRESSDATNRFLRLRFNFMYFFPHYSQLERGKKVQV
jgi:hypothetical protein